MKQFLHFCISALILLIGLKGHAQDISLNDYLNILKEQSLLIQQSSNQVLDATLDVRSAKSQLLPSLGTELSYQRDFSKNFLFFNDEDFGLTKLRTNFNNTVNADLIAEQAVYDAVASKQFQAAKLAAKQTELNHLETVNVVLLQGSRLFLQSLFVQNSLTIIEESLQLAEQQKVQTQDLFESGLVSELELRQAELYYKQALPQVAEAKNAYQTLLNELKTLASLPQDYELIPTGNIVSKDNAISTDKSLEANLELQSINQALKVSNLAIKAREAEWNPMVKVSLGYNLNAQDNEFRFKNDNRLWYGRVSVQFPIVTGGLNSAQLQKARVSKDNVQLELQHTRLSLNTKLENHYLDLELARQKIRLQEDVLRVAKKEFEISEFQASRGHITAIDRKQARLDLSQAKLDLLEAHLQASLTRLEIDKTLGKSLIREIK